MRRLFSAILTLALAQFGAVAAAPAHAHEDGGSHGVREIVLAHGHAHADAALGHHDDHHDAVPNGAAAPPADDQRGDPGGEHAAHVHSCPQFAPAETGAVAHVGNALSIDAWPLGDQHVASRSTAPPLRPPRTFL